MDRELFEAARAVRQKAHAPYSDHLVGAALRTEDGNIYAGCNVENASYPEGWCSETSAIASMIVASSTESDRIITAICVVAEQIDGRLVTPCGGCRQRIAEFSHPDTVVHVANVDGDGQSFRLDDLLPVAFSMEASA
jgi:cytidine deaminase